jgi:hypothetical protein
MTKRAIFLGYCAYAPFIHAIATLLLFDASSGADPNALIFYSLMTTLPLSAWFCIETVNFPAAAGHLSYVSHSLIYFHFYMAKVLGEINGSSVNFPSDEVVLIAITISMIAASIALLMTWDAMRRKQEIVATAQK